MGERRISPGSLSGLSPLRAAWRNPSFKPLSILDFNHHAGSHPLWWRIGHFVEVIMQDRRRGEWARLAMRGLQLLEDDRASVLGEAGATEARVDKLPLAIVLPQD